MLSVPLHLYSTFPVEGDAEGNQEKGSGKILGREKEKKKGVTSCCRLLR